MSILDKYAYVYFVCEGTNEEAIVKWLHQEHWFSLDNSHYSIEFRRCRASKGKEILRKRCFELDYGGPVAVAYLCDSLRENWKLKPNILKQEIPIIRVLTPPEIEILLTFINEKVESEWNKAYRRNRKLHPSEFCREYFKCNIKNGNNFIEQFGDIETFIDACKKYKSQHKKQICIADIIK